MIAGYQQVAGIGGTGIIWLRNDLRLSDHEPFMAAQAQCQYMVPVYIFDPRDFGQVHGTHGL